MEGGGSKKTEKAGLIIQKSVDGESEILSKLATLANTWTARLQPCGHQLKEISAAARAPLDQRCSSPPRELNLALEEY